MKVPLKLQPRLGSLECSECGARASASCKCGAPYVPARARAVAVLTEHPEKSDRAIAAEIGVGHATVSRARSTVPDETVDERIGRDGKVRRLPRRRSMEYRDDEEANAYKIFMIRADLAVEFAFYNGKVTDEVVTAAEEAAAAWQDL